MSTSKAGCPGRASRQREQKIPSSPSPAGPDTFSSAFYSQSHPSATHFSFLGTPDGKWQCVFIPIALGHSQQPRSGVRRHRAPSWPGLTSAPAAHP
uniref:Uncharacterized protein n=1 Tax=Macaca nemestrina TaxID=9545 RepID=A0A2K6AMK6_MACNE